MKRRETAALEKLTGKAEWLKSRFGDYAMVPDATEPQRDDTPAADLPPYVIVTSVIDYPEVPVSLENAEYYTLEGMKVDTPLRGHIYIVVTPDAAFKVKF